MIPVLIVPILNGPDHLWRLLNSIDHPIRKIIVIDNGGVVDVSGDVPINVIQPGHNLGVAASWNLGLKVTPKVPWWLITNHDIVFGPGDLERLASTVDEDSFTRYFMRDMAAFALTQETLGRVGYFDENFHPAYDEDMDWDRRARLTGCKRVDVPFTGSHVGSATISTDAVYWSQNSRTHAANDEYYAAKWGGHKEGGETFDTPFDLGGDLRDWRLDPERLRTQGWVK